MAPGSGAVQRLALAAAGALVLAAAPAARAQETLDREFGGLQGAATYLRHVHVRALAANRFVGPSDFGSFDASQNQSEGRLSFEFPVNENAVARILGTGRAISWGFNGSSNLFGMGTTRSDPFGTLDAWTLRVQGGYLLPEQPALFAEHERWGLLVEGWGRAAWEAGSDMTEGLRGGGAIAFGYQLPDRLELALGVTLGSNLLTGGVSASPIVEFKWRINDHWKLRNAGLGAEVEYDVSKRLEFYARVRYEGSSFRLANRGGSVGRGAVRLHQLPVGVGFRWKPLRWFHITTRAGVMAYDQIEVRSASDHKISRVTGDLAPYVSLRFDLR